MHRTRVDTFGPTTNKHTKGQLVQLDFVETLCGSEGDHFRYLGVHPSVSG